MTTVCSSILGVLLFGVICSVVAFPVVPQDEVALVYVGEVSPFEISPVDDTNALVREKRQNFRRRPGQGGNRYPGGQGGFQQPGFQQPGFSGGASSALAQSQAFNAGNFGASSAGSGTQGFQVGPNGFSGSAGQSLSQNYNFPGGISASVSLAESFGVGPGGVTRGGGNSVSITGPNGAPIRG